MRRGACWYGLESADAEEGTRERDDAAVEDHVSAQPADGRRQERGATVPRVGQAGGAACAFRVPRNRPTAGPAHGKFWSVCSVARAQRRGWSWSTSNVQKPKFPAAGTTAHGALAPIRTPAIGSNAFDALNRGTFVLMGGYSLSLSLSNLTFVGSAASPGLDSR